MKTPSGTRLHFLAVSLTRSLNQRDVPEKNRPEEKKKETKMLGEEKIRKKRIIASI